MKKVICILLILCLFPVVCLADVDLSSMSYSELLMLRNKLNEEIMSRPQWKEVRVPSGDWVVGSDIPAGTYSVRPVTYGMIIVKNARDRSVVSSVLTEGEQIGRVVLDSGYTVHLEKDFIFAPAVSLGF